MDANQLRLILFFCGLALVIGIYLWDRLNRRRFNRQAREQAERMQPSVHLDEDAVGAEEILNQGIFPDTEQEPEIKPFKLTAEHELKLDDEVLDETEELHFSIHAEHDYLHVDPDLEEDAPRLIIQINIVNPTRLLTGDEIMSAMEEVQMEPGEMAIFHRYDASRRESVLFSIASQVEPGSFPFNDISGFETPGLTMFTQLPGVHDGMMIYSDMLFTAQRLAVLLDAELLDESRSTLTKQTIEHTRSSILEHRRQLELARRRH